MLKKIMSCFLATILLLSLKPVCAENRDYIYVGYCEGEEYYEFDYTLNCLIWALAENGMISEDINLPIDTKSRDTWAYLAQQDQSNWKVRFVRDAFFSFTHDKYLDISNEQISNEMLDVVQNKNVDIMLALGTNASLSAKKISSYCGVLSMMTTDPLQSDIIDELETSNIDNMWALVDIEGISQSIAVMYDIFEPKTVGVVYENTEDAYIYSGASDLDRFAALNGFAVKKIFVSDPQSFNEDEIKRFNYEITTAYEQLAEEVDVFILTPTIFELNEMKNYLKPFYENKIPVYSITGSEDVKYGALMSVEVSDYKNIGRFVADTIKKYMAGKKLMYLPQVFESAPFLSINYNTAKLIGFKPSFDMLLVANNIYME